VTAVPETAGWIPDLLKETAFEAEAYLMEKAAEIEPTGLTVAADVEMVISGSVAEGILSYAIRNEADVIVMSTHGRSGLGRWVFGSVADRVLHAADIPVWLVRAEVESEAA
jgi:nucleotide-binding universal stress UspA family protein